MPLYTNHFQVIPEYDSNLSFKSWAWPPFLHSSSLVSQLTHMTSNIRRCPSITTANFECVPKCCTSTKSHCHYNLLLLYLHIWMLIIWVHCWVSIVIASNTVKQLRAYRISNFSTTVNYKRFTPKHIITAIILLHTI